MVPVLHVGTMAVGLIWGITMQRLYHTPPVRAGANCQDFVYSLFLYRAFSIFKVDVDITEAKCAHLYFPRFNSKPPIIHYTYMHFTSGIIGKPETRRTKKKRPETEWK